MTREVKERVWQLVMVMLTVFLIFAYVEFWITRRPPAIDYEMVTSPGYGDSFCAGDHVNYHAQFDVRAPPTVVTIVRTLWNDDTDTYVGTDASPPLAVREGGIIASPPGFFLVPESLPEGNYRLDVVAHGTDERATDFGIMFHVRNC